MADIAVTCIKCGHEHTVSEYTSPDDMQCVACGGPLEIPVLEKTSGLKVRQAGGAEKPFLTAPAKPTKSRLKDQGLKQSESATLEDVYKTHDRPKGVKAFGSWVAFFALTAFLIWMQMMVRDDPSMLTTYNWVRGIVGGLVYLLVIVVAFEDHLWQGLLALVFPPYCIYYALIRLDAYLLRNIFLAVVVSFVAELHFIRDDALITHAQSGMEEFIRSGESMIQRAGDAPTYN